MLQAKLNQSISEKFEKLEKLLNMIHIVGYKEIADNINQTIYSMLPIQDKKYIISDTIDIVNGKIQNDEIFKVIQVKNKSTIKGSIAN